MSLLLVAATLMSASAATPQSRCERPGARHALADATPVTPQRLGYTPPADRIATVFRTDEQGCSRPVVLQRNLGSDPAPR